LTKGDNLPSDLNRIIAELEQQRAAFDRALAALREVGGAAGSAGAEATTPAKRKRVLSPEGRRRIIAAIKKRWALRRAQKVAPKKRRGLTAAGRKRLSELMKARWASNNPPKPSARKKSAASA
jgi:hypothetical protein